MRGFTTIQLFDAITGKEVKRVESKNMFTNALDSLYNKIPYKLGNPLIKKYTGDGFSVDYAPVYSKGLGGILLFPNAITESASHLYEPLAHQPTGIASMEAYSGADSRRGNFNANLSGEVDDLNGHGYRYVYEFDTAKAIGTISCVCLTSLDGGKSYFSGTESIVDRNAYYEFPAASFREGAITPYVSCLKADDEGFWFIAQEEDFGTTAYLYKAKFRQLYVPLTEVYASDLAEKVATLTKPNTQTDFASDDDYLYLLSSSGTTVSWTRYKYADGTTTTGSATITGFGGLPNSYYRHAVGDGKLFILDTTGKLFYINLSNTADNGQITGTFSTDDRDGMMVIDGIGLYTRNGWVDTANNVLINATEFTSRNSLTSRCGVWSGRTNTRSYQGVNYNSAFISPYLATINNLQDSVTKDAGKTMKVTYTVYET